MALYHTVNGSPVEVKKHQLMGPVGYTVVGSPTITDGVVSGFSNSDYLIATQAYPAEITSYEKNIRFKWGGSIVGYQTFFGGTGYDRVIFTSSTYLLIGMRRSTGTLKDWSVGLLPLVVDNWYVMNIKFENGIVVLKLFSDDGTLLTTTSTDFDAINSPNTTLRIGQATADGGGFFQGSIDLNNTYIKVNGKLWFYQPAPTKYIIKDDKLVWADPNIYLQSTGTQKIDTGLIRNGINDSYRFVTSISYQDNQTRQLNGSTGFVYFGALDGYYQITNSGTVHTNVLCPLDEFVNVDVFFDCPNQSCSYTVGSASSSFNLSLEGNSYSSAEVGIYLFNITNNSFPCKCKMKPFKIYKNGILVRDFVAVPAGLPIGNFTVPSTGMFDMVNQQFHPNQGTGSFTMGRDE